MIRSRSNGEVILRLLSGPRASREIVLEDGLPRPPFAVGSHAALGLASGHHGSTNVFAAFNGTSLFVCALRGENARLDGAPLDGRWIRVAMPSELVVGGLRISIFRRTRSEAVTRFDEERLAAALRLFGGADENATRVAPVEVPAAAKGPAPDDLTVPPSPPMPVTRPFTRAVQVVRKRIPPPPPTPTVAQTERLLAGLATSLPSRR